MRELFEHPGQTMIDEGCDHVFLQDISGITDILRNERNEIFFMCRTATAKMIFTLHTNKMISPFDRSDGIRP